MRVRLESICNNPWKADKRLNWKLACNLSGDWRHRKAGIGSDCKVTAMMGSGNLEKQSKNLRKN